MSVVALINPHWYLSRTNQDDLWLSPPMGLLSLAASLRAAGHQVHLIDSLALGYRNRRWVRRGKWELLRVGLEEAEIKSRLTAIGPDLVGVGNIFSAVFRGSRECLEWSREILPRAVIVAGGVHPSSAPEEVAALDFVDYAVRGEGEYCLLDLIRHIDEPQDQPPPPGVWFKKRGRIENTGKPRIIRDLDKLPMAAFDLLDMDLYKREAGRDLISRGGGGSLSMPVLTSRGCPYGCIFCGAHLINGKLWRGRSAKNVLDEMEYLHTQWGVNSFTIEDSNFVSDEKRALDICRGIVDRGLNIRWNTPNGIRADCITPRLAQAMRRSGCHEVALAAEHGDQDFLNRVVRKGLDLEKIFSSARLLQAQGMKITCFLMMGFPGEKPAHLAKTAAFARRLARAGVLPLIFISSPLPGTRMYDDFKALGCLKQKVYEPEDYLSSIRAPIMSLELDLERLRKTTMLKALLILFVYHPAVFFSFPAVRNLLKSLVSPAKTLQALRKLRNHFA